MSRKGNITQKMVQKLTARTDEGGVSPVFAKAQAEGQHIVYDDIVPGFGVRITANGVISFILNYFINGRKRRLTIGRFPEWSADAARDEAVELRKRIRQGDDPLEKPVNSELTVKDLAKDYLERHAMKNKRKSSIRNDKSMLEGIIEPKLGALTLSGVGRRDIEALHHSLKGTPYRANRVISLLSKMFSLAMDWKWISENPAKKIPRYNEDKRETWLNEEQLRNLLAALDDYPNGNAADAIRLAIFTGSREGEVLGADWTQFDMKRGIWVKPSHHVKEKKIEHVPLNDNALAILKRMVAAKAAKNSPYLFPGPAGPDKKKAKARVSIRRCWVQVCKAAGLATAVEVQGKKRKLTRWKPVLRVHDLRHTFASHLVSRGESLHIVGKLLGHTRAETTMRYSHVADEAARKAANRFSEVIAQ